MNSIWDTTNIKKARESAELLVKDAAGVLNVTPEYLSMIENGHRTPSQKLIARMSELYKQPTSYFLASEKNLALQ